MSTRSAIIVKTGNQYMGIYCHFDGYPSHTGKMLRDHYNSQEAAESIVALGDASQLRESIEDSVFYMRDRNEEDCEAITGPTAGIVASHIGHNSHVYVFADGSWTHNGTDIDEAIRRDS